MAIYRAMFLVLSTFVLQTKVLHAENNAVPYQSNFSITYTFTTSTPAKPIDVGGDRDLIVNSYLATTINDSGSGILHEVAGHCTNIRFTDRVKKTIDSHGYCNFKDKNGDHIYAEYVTDTPKPGIAISLKCKFMSGTGQYEGITGTFDGTNTNNIDEDGSYQAAGKFVGSYKIVRSTTSASFGMHD